MYYWEQKLVKVFVGLPSYKKIKELCIITLLLNSNMQLSSHGVYLLNASVAQ